MSTVISSAAEGAVIALAGRRIDAEPADVSHDGERAITHNRPLARHVERPNAAKIAIGGLQNIIIRSNN
jgi:hypothetical protein